MRLVAIPNGPLMLAETGRLVDAEGRALTPPVYLCRCGASRHKPYCDGSHGAIGFRAEGAEFRSAPGPSLHVLPADHPERHEDHRVPGEVVEPDHDRGLEKGLVHEEMHEHVEGPEREEGE